MPMGLAPTNFEQTRWGHVYDGDQHVHEPPDFWYTRLPAKYRALAPRVVEGPDGKAYYRSADGNTEAVTDMRTAIGGIPEIAWSAGSYAYADIRPSSWDPKARLEDMDVDYVYAAIIHPNRFDFNLFPDDAELQKACVGVYNDWMSEFCAVDPDRLLGVAQIPRTGVDDAIAELRRVRELPGIRGVVCSWWPSGDDWPTPADDPFWYAAEAMQMPIIIHRAIGSTRMGAPFAARGGRYKEALTLGHLQLERLGSSYVPALSYMIIGGVLERCPRLHRDRVRMGAVLPRAERRQLSPASLLFGNQPFDAPQRLLPSAVLEHVPGRSLRHREPSRRRGQVHLVIGLPSCRSRLAQLCEHHRKEPPGRTQ
jgi:predicted TIM-barrel fold metal-dependent hydrolase